MHVVILGNQARAMSNFWSVLIRQMREAGHTVTAFLPFPASPDDAAWENAIKELDVTISHYPLDRKGLNPLRDIRTLIGLFSLFRKRRPDVLFAFTIKPVIYGAFASALAGFPRRENRHVMITGLGYMFEADSPLKKCLLQVARGLYRLAFSFVHTVFFQNQDDKALFEKLSIIPASAHVAFSKGTGVDLQHFTAAPLPQTAAPNFLFIGRLIEAKGVRDFYEAAKLVKQQHPQATFSILGPEEKGVGSVPKDEILAWERQGVITYLGETKDVRPFIADANVIVLPSWREGTPCSLMEAMSMSRPLIAADAPGSREVVQQDINGFLVPVRSPAALAAAMMQYILQPKLMQQFGEQSRQIAENEFDAKRVAQHIMQTMRLC